MSKPVPATDITPRVKASNYPAPFAARVEGRIKRALGDAFGLKNFGVNLTTLKPGAVSALHHVHEVQDEFIYILSGHPTLRLGAEEFRLAPGVVAGFPAQGEAHHLRNDTGEDVTYLEIGDRLPGDGASYPDDDLSVFHDGEKWVFSHKDGTPY